VIIPELSGRCVLITGASSGIGRVTAQVLAQRGARLLLLNRDEHASQQLVTQLRGQGGQAEHITLDLDDLN
jgi:short-subunit dehydrogenase